MWYHSRYRFINGDNDIDNVCQAIYLQQGSPRGNNNLNCWLPNERFLYQNVRSLLFLGSLFFNE